MPAMFKTFVVSLLLLPAFSAFAWNNNPPIENADDDQMCLREDIAGWAQNFLGIPYKYGLSDPNKGFDCSGFTSYVLEEFGIDVSRSSTYQSTQGTHVPLNEVMPGDLVFFAARTRISHVAMVVKRTEEGIFCVHATCSRGIIVENISTSKYWAPKIRFARDVISGNTQNISPSRSISANAFKPAVKHATAHICQDLPLFADLVDAGRRDALRSALFCLPQQHSAYDFQ